MMAIGGRGSHVEVLNAVRHDSIGFTYQNLGTYGRQVNRNIVNKLPHSIPVVQQLSQTSQLVHHRNFQPATSTLYHNPHLHGNDFVGFTDPTKPGPSSRVICGLDGGHPCVCITSQACQTLYMRPQELWDG